MSAGADFFHDIGGTMSEDAPSYIERPADMELLAALERHELCLVLAPRQTGKSSLIVHAMARLRPRGMRVGIVDFQPLGKTTNFDQLFSAILKQLKRELSLKVNEKRWWEENHNLGSTQRFITFLEEVVLSEIAEDVVIVFDEIDSLVKLPFSDDFFTTLRYVHNARATNPTFRRLTFVIMGVATATSFIKDSTRTPFNIGTSIQLTDFDKRAVGPFKRVLGEHSDELIDRIFYWSNGQPLLVQKLAAAAFRWPPVERTIERLDEEVSLSYGRGRIQQDTHLKFIEKYLLDESPQLRRTLRTYRRVLKGEHVPNLENSPVQMPLKLAGVVRIEEGRLTARNRIYQSIFDHNWIKAHLPAEINPKWVAAAAACVAAFALVWVMVLRPLLLPSFPNIKTVVWNIDRYDAELRLPVGRVPLAVIGENAIAVSSDGVLRLTPENLAGGEKLVVGTNTRRLVLSGLFTSITVEVQVNYYPGWIVRQFPDAQLGEIVEPGGAVGVVKEKGRDDVVGSDSFVLRAAANGRVLRQFVGHQKPVTKVIRSSDGALFCSISEDKTLRLWQADNGKQLLVKKDDWQSDNGKDLLEKRNDLRVTDGFSDAAFLRDEKGTTMVAVSRRGALYRLNSYAAADQMHYAFSLPINMDEFTDKAPLPKERDIYLALSPDRKYIAEGDENGLLVRSFQTGKPEPIQSKDINRVLSVAFSPVSINKSYQVATGRTSTRLTYLDPRLQIEEVGSWQVIKKSSPLTSEAVALAYEPTRGGALAAGETDGTVILWNFPATNEPETLGRFSGSGPLVRVRSIYFSPDGKLVFAQSAGGETKVWNVDDRVELPLYKGHRADVTSVLYSPDGKTLVSKDADDQGCLWDVQKAASLQSFDAPGQIAYAPNGKALLLQKGNALILRSVDVAAPHTFWDELRTFTTEGEVGDFRFSSSGDRLLSRSGINRVTVWNVDNGVAINSVNLSEGNGPAAFSPNGKLMLGARPNSTLELWNLERDGIGYNFSEVTDFSYLSFSSDNKKFGVQGADGSVRVWDVDTESLLGTYSAARTSRPFEFSPDGRMLLLNQATGLSVWDIENKKELGRFNETAWAFSPDGKLLALWGGALAVTLYRVEDGREIRKFPHSEPIVAASFSPDGRQLVTASKDNTLRLWWAAPDSQN